MPLRSAGLRRGGRSVILALFFSLTAFAECEVSAGPRKLDGIVLVIADGTSLELITAARN